MEIKPNLDAKLEGWNLIEVDLPGIPVPQGLESEITNAFKALDKIDETPGDGKVTINATVKVPTKGRLRFLEPVTGKTLDIELDFDLALVK